MLPKFFIFALLIISVISIGDNENDEILENENNKKYSDIKLINVISNVIEYHDNYNSIEFNFDADYIFIQNLKNLKYSDKYNKIYVTKLENCREKNNNIVCGTNLFIRAGNYKIINLSYGDELIKTKGDLFFAVKEDILELQKAYPYTGSGIHNDKFNVVHLQFENIAYTKYFSSFLFKNVRTNKIYNADYKFLFDNGGSVSEPCIFDFKNLPPGEYYISYIYKRKIQNTNIKIKIEPFKLKNEYDLYPD